MPNLRRGMMGAAGSAGGGAYTLWVWGSNAGGKLGLGDAPYVYGNNKFSPVQVGDLSTWTYVQVMEAMFAFKLDGTLWGWGKNTGGELGDGTVLNRSSPVQVGSATDWFESKSVSGDGVPHVIKSDGTLWTWGQAWNGQAGRPDGLIAKSTPTQVGTDTDWAKVSVYSGNTHAVRTDGTLWCWGQNSIGSLGLGDGNSDAKVSSPTQIGSSTDWATPGNGGSTGFAIKTGGTLWSWGLNYIGQLGQNDVVSRSSPVQVGSLTNWSQISGGDDHVMAIKTDGTLWGWGKGIGIGGGNTISRSSPVQIGSDTDWAFVEAANEWTVARRTDGTLWAWGNAHDYGTNAQGSPGGATGDNQITNSSPVQIGSATTFIRISAHKVTGALLDA